MPFSDDLLSQSRVLAAADARGRPKQANLRRAVSTAYYALFHFLIDEACRSMVGAGGDRRSLRGVLARAFDHRVMRDQSAAFASGNPSPKLTPALDAAGVPADLRDIADSFRTLQLNRHRADYNVLLRFNRTETVRLIDQSAVAMQRWAAVRGTAAGRLFLVALLVGDRIRE
jgi:hypothetical protein